MSVDVRKRVNGEWRTSITIEVYLDGSYSEVLESLTSAADLMVASGIPTEDVRVDATSHVDGEVTHALYGQRPSTEGEISAAQHRIEVERNEEARRLRKRLSELDGSADL